MLTGERAVERLSKRFGVHPGYRTLHAKGTFCRGTFAATPEGAALGRAPHLQAASVPVLARLSNGSGDPGAPDHAPDVRGCAVSFELPDGSRTDIVAQSMPRFPVRTPEAFLDFVEASERNLSAMWKLPLVLLRNPVALAGLRENGPRLKPPASYAQLRYFAIHAFRWTAPDGTQRWVRLRIEPTAGEAFLSAADAKALGADFLREDLLARTAGDGVAFDVVAQVAADGDDPHDPTSVWAGAGAPVVVGTIVLDQVVLDADPFIFDPMRLCDGIEPSDDPILRFRPAAYGVSFARRAPS